MTVLVKPDEIESQLKEIWGKLAKENKTRACLFNLIVFNRYSLRTDYIRNIVQKVIDKFPCRIIFISEDPEQKEPYLKTAVSVMMAENIACDHIDIGVAGNELERVPFVVLPHILPDLPVTLLWTENPSVPHPLFQPLKKLAHRLIFDSESADHLVNYSKTVLGLSESGYDVADLNWARTEGWRDLFASVFRDGLKDVAEIHILYNARPTEFFCHLKIQSMYLLSWLSSRLKWKFQTANKKLEFKFENFTANIESTQWEKLGPGTIISVKILTHKGNLFDCARIKERYHYVNVQISSEHECKLPYQFVLGQTATGQSLVKEICRKGTSEHYLEMLRGLIILDKDQVC